MEKKINEIKEKFNPNVHLRHGASEKNDSC